MKRLNLLVACMFVLGAISSCQNASEELSAITENEKEKQNTYYVPFEEALAKAERYIGGNESHSRAQQVRKVKEHYEYVVPKLGTRANEGEEVKFHVINFEDNAGFALVSADSRTTDVYAYSTSGYLDMEEASENTGFGIFMDCATEYYEREIDNYEPAVNIPTLPPVPIDSIYGDIPYLATEEIDGTLYHVRYGDYITIGSKDALLTVKWDQFMPYNYYCPTYPNVANYYDGKAAAGCGPVAAAQIMSYFQYPIFYPPYTFNWEHIMQSPSYYTYSIESLATANLIRAIGIEAGARYGESTSTNIDEMANTFSKMGYTFSGVSDFYDLNIMNSLDNNRLVYIRGENSSGKGHAWVIDGYSYEKKETTYYYTYVPYDIFRIVRDYKTYYHCNWGWGGLYNAWTLDTFVVPDEDSTSYRSDLRIIYNIKPNN